VARIIWMSPKTSLETLPNRKVFVERQPRCVRPSMSSGSPRSELRDDCSGSTLIATWSTKSWTSRPQSWGVVNIWRHTLSSPYSLKSQCCVRFHIPISVFLSTLLKQWFSTSELWNLFLKTTKQNNKKFNNCVILILFLSWQSIKNWI
jgi:hypothetical protein